MRLRIVHHTHYRYAPAVVMAQHLAHLRIAGQQRVSKLLRHLPGKAALGPVRFGAIFALAHSSALSMSRVIMAKPG